MSSGNGDHNSQGQRDRIRRAAVRLFNQLGYEATSVKQLGQELGMAPANLYNYYTGKEDILFDVLKHQMQELIAREEKIVVEESDPVRRLWGLACDLVEHDLEEPQAAFVGRHGLQGLNGRRRREISSLMDRVRGIWIDVVSEGAALGRFAVEDPKLDTLTLLTLCSSVPSWYSPDGEYSAYRVAQRTADLVLSALGQATNMTQMIGATDPETSDLSAAHMPRPPRRSPR